VFERLQVFVLEQAVLRLDSVVGVDIYQHTVLPITAHPPLEMCVIELAKID